MTSIFLRDGAGVGTDDTTSSAFPDYSHDTIWVGGAFGWLHKITGGFAGTPAEVRTGGFPVQVNPGNPTILSSPVYDRTSTNVFVGDYGGFLYRVSSTGAVTKSAQIDFGAGLVAGPVVDSTAGKVYVFSSSDGSTSCTGFVPCSAVYLFATNFGPGHQWYGSEGRKQPGCSSQPQSSVRRQLRQHVPCFRECHRQSLRLRKYRRQPDHVSDSNYCRRDGNCRCRAALANITTGCSPVTDIPNPNATRRSDRMDLRRRANDRIGEQLRVRRMHPESQGSTLDAIHSLRRRPAGAGYKLSGSGRPMWQERREPLAQGHPNWN